MQLIDFWSLKSSLKSGNQHDFSKCRTPRVTRCLHVLYYVHCELYNSADILE